MTLIVTTRGMNYKLKSCWLQMAEKELKFDQQTLGVLYLRPESQENVLIYGLKDGKHFVESIIAQLD